MSLLTSVNVPLPQLHGQLKAFDGGKPSRTRTTKIKE